MSPVTFPIAEPNQQRTTFFSDASTDYFIAVDDPRMQNGFYAVFYDPTLSTAVLPASSLVRIIGSAPTVSFTITVHWTDELPFKLTSVTLEETPDDGSKQFAKSAPIAMRAEPGAPLVISGTFTAGVAPGKHTAKITIVAESIPPGVPVTQIVMITGATVAPAPILSAKKTVRLIHPSPPDVNPDPPGGIPPPTDAVLRAVYSILVSNTGPKMFDNPGPEIVDTLPSGVLLDSASASDGVTDVPLTDTAGNTIRWSGSILSASHVLITARTRVTASAGRTITNTATVNYDKNGDGDNEAKLFADASFIMPAIIIDVPALSPFFRGALAVLLAMCGVVALANRP